MEKYNHKKIEGKWQKSWEEKGIYKTSEEKDRDKFYVLDMFPYPSGAGLHVGHPKGYIATDIFARTKRMKGFNVLHPMGWDAFGLPAENFAIKNKMHPAICVEKNIATFKKQLGKLGFSYDWEREINTTDPSFYKWTQWTFIQMFKKGLAYESYEPINWCPSCKTGLANEDLENGKCERCGSEIEKKPIRQWVLKITDYADRMLQDLDKLPNWDKSIKDMQRNWIGKSEGAHIEFKIKDFDYKIKVFTTRPDTLFGATYMVLAPEHALVQELKGKIENWDEVEKYIKESKKKSEIDRMDLTKEKTGVKLEGIFAINPTNSEELSIFIADYVLSGYGTGAIMAVPAHDERDFEFATKFGLKIKEVIKGGNLGEGPYLGDGVLLNSGEFDGLASEEAKQKIVELVGGEIAINYRIQDWVFSRQRYWGEPIPIVHCEKCGAVPLPEDQLPLKLPEVKNYEPTGTGESPLAGIDEWVNTTCPKCGGPAKRETNTMPQWAGSSWYYLRFIDPRNDKKLINKDKDKYWSPVDFYVGGAEHATRHLIYARFWHKFLFDIGVVNYDEPFERLQHVGLILAEDGRKMSKRWGNVINPDEIVDTFGADSMRIYEMFMGPFSQSCAWNTNGLMGARRFLEKIWKIFWNLREDFKSDKDLIRELHKTIKKVGNDIEEFKLNTGVSSMMKFVNLIEEKKGISREDFKQFLKILSPFAPHITEEIWEKLGQIDSIYNSEWPKYDEKLAQDEKYLIAVQINGKVRSEIEIEEGESNEVIEKQALKDEKVVKWIGNNEIKKMIYIKNRVLNIVI